MNTLADKIKVDSEQRKSEYKPLKVDWYKLDEQKAWLKLTSRYEFDLFATLTFREDTERWLAEKRFEKWIVSLNKVLFGKRYKQRGRGIRYVVVYGNQKRGNTTLSRPSRC